ncbi:MAG: DNA polymerase III subunit beta [Gammaproteobacteria bacterium]|nr:DNA polymerase III subunit beta [Gammaproteobacteria bacterium]
MKFTSNRDTLLKPLQQIIGAVERRQTLPALGNILLRTTETGLTLTATDLEVELVATVDNEIITQGEITLPARKFLDIIRALPENAVLDFELDNEKIHIKSGRSKFILATLPAAEFPVLDDFKGSSAFSVKEEDFKKLIEKTGFAMAQQDVRYYLNGLMIELDDNKVRAIATDGHRLAICAVEANISSETGQQVIVPRKGILELARLLVSTDNSISIELSANHIRVNLDGIRFTSKLIDGRFPEYKRVMPADADKLVTINRDVLKQALTRASILSNEKYRGIRLQFSTGNLSMQANNPDQEEAEEEIEITYDNQDVEIGFNVNYLLDVLSVTEGDEIKINLKDGNSSALIEDSTKTTGQYVIMPMRL